MGVVARALVRRSRGVESANAFAFERARGITEGALATVTTTTRGMTTGVANGTRARAEGDVPIATTKTTTTKTTMKTTMKTNGGETYAIDDEANAPECAVRVERRTKREALDVTRGVRWVKANAKAKFAETVEMSVHLGVDPKRSDMIVRGVVRLPHGTGNAVRVGVFAEGEEAEVARVAGATIVGGEELIREIKEGGAGAIKFDKCIGTPKMMPKLKEIARILGPRGLMPNPKLGTVTADVGPAVKELLGGRVEFRAEKNAIVHTMVGKVTFEDSQLEENIAAVFKEILALRPKGKGAPNAGKYLKKAYLASTMGKGSAKLDLVNLTEVANAYGVRP